MAMKLALALAAPLLLALPALAEPVPLDAISAYLNGLGAAKAGFVQGNADGSSASGTIHIQRPGRMRFEYAPPDATLVLASGGQLAIFDGKSSEPPQQYPLALTPLNLILGADIDLAGSKMLAGHLEEGETTLVRAQDPDHPEYGMIELRFSKDPLALTGWVISDDLGQQTAITLQGLTPVDRYPPSFFSLTMEKARRGF